MAHYAPAPERLEELEQQLKALLGSRLEGSTIAYDELTLEIAPRNWLQAAYDLKDFGFEQLVDLCGVDYLTYKTKNWETQGAENKGFSRGVMDFDLVLEDKDLHMPRRFATVVHLLSVTQNHRVRIKIYAEDSANPRIPSVTEVWNSANWFER